MGRKSDDEEREFNRALGRRIERYRRLRKLKVKDLAARAQITPQRVTAYEAGEYGCSTRTLLRIAEALAVPVALLIAEQKKQEHLVSSCAAARE